MKKRAWFIAVAAALLGALTLHVYLQRYELEAAGGPPQQVVAVTRDLALGETLTQGAVALRSLPEQYLEERHVLAEQLDHVLGTRVTSQVASGSMLLWSDLDVMQSSRTLSGLVRPGMRAFPLPGRDASFDGLLRPGDRVDVLLTQRGALEQTRTLLQNVLVLTVGSDLGQQEAAESKRGRRSSAVTLSVTADQAQLLAHSAGQGELRLTLRNPQDLVLAEGLEPTRSLSSAGLPSKEVLRGR